MKFEETSLPGVYVIDPVRLEDERGFFARTWSTADMEAHGLAIEIAQSSISFNRRKGTLRGMHFQAAPMAEAKIVRCTQGAIYDVALDLRPESPSFTRWVAAELSQDNRRMFYIPKGCAHGYQTLTDDTEVMYLISTAYSPAHGRGVRWDDPAFGIDWPPADARIINERDRTYPDFLR